MTGNLRQYFPMIKSREEILEEIASKSHLKKMFSQWTETQQGEFLDFCTGVRGVKLLYDSFFKEIIQCVCRKTPSFSYGDIIQHINQTTMSSIPVNTMWYGAQSIGEKY